MTSRWQWATALASAIPLASGCGEDESDWEGSFDNEVEVNAATGVDFSMYQTFAIVGVSMVPPQFLEGIPAPRRTDLDFVNAEAARELRELGLTQVQPDQSPELLLFSLATSDLDTALRWECMAGWNWGGYFAGWTWNPCAWLQRDLEWVNVHTFVTGLADPQRNDVVFAGFIGGIEEPDIEPKDVIAEGVAEVYDDYPARPN